MELVDEIKYNIQKEAKSFSFFNRLDWRHLEMRRAHV